MLSSAWSHVSDGGALIATFRIVAGAGCDDINMSFQNKDSTNTIKEIINMVKVNKLTMKLSIKLKTGRIIHFRIE